MKTRTKLDVATLIYAHLATDTLGTGFYCCHIARATGLKPSTVSSFLNRMERVGSVKRRDGRRYHNSHWVLVPKSEAA